MVYYAISMYPNTATRLMCINRICASETKAKKDKFQVALVYSLTLLALISSFFADAKVDAGMEKEKAVAQTRTSLVLEIGKALQQKDAETKFFRLFNGGAGQPSDFWKARLAILANNPQTALGIDIQQLTNEQLKGAFGAFTRKGVNGLPAIYLNQNWLEKQAGKAGLQRVMAEEMGHAIDFYLNGNLETPGDEGEAFAHSLLNLPVSAEEAQRMLVENDIESVVIEGKEIVVEDAAVYFNQVYKNGTGTNYDLQSNSITSIQRVLGTGFKFTSANPADATFALNSGNNVGGTLTYVDPQGVVRSVSGGITRKEQGNPSKGFYFYVSPTEAYWLVIPGYEAQYANGQNVSTSSDKSNMLSDLNSMLTAQQSAPKITVSSPTVAETAGSVVFDLTVSPNATSNYSFTPTITAVTAVAGTNYTTTGVQYKTNTNSTYTNFTIGSVLSFTTAVNSIQIKVPVLNDGVTRPTLYFNLNTGPVSNGGVLNNEGAYGQAAITDVTPAPVITQNPVTKTYGDGTFTLSPTSTNTTGGGYSYAVTGNSGVLTVNNGTFTIVGAGTTQITITQAPSNGYGQGTKVVNATVNKATLTVSADDKTKTYGAVNPTLTPSYNGFVYNQTLATSGVNGTPALSTTATITSDVNTYPITAAVGSLVADNYSFAFTPGTLTVNKATVTVNANDKVEPVSSNALPLGNNFDVTYSGFVNGNTSSVITSGQVSFTGTAPAATAAGTYTIVPDVNSLVATNYNFVAGATGTLTITNLQIANINQPDITKTYGDQSFSITPATNNSTGNYSYALTGMQGVVTLSGNTLTIVGVGTTQVTITQAADNTHAEGSKVVNVTVNPRPLTVTATASNKQYDGSDIAVVSLGDDRINNDVVDVHYTASTFSNANVGQNKQVTVSGITLTGTAAGNYTLAATSAVASANITPAPVTITVNETVKQYGFADPVFTYSQTGLIGGDQLTGTVTRASGTSVGTYAFSGLTNSNYTVSFVPANFTV